MKIKKTFLKWMLFIFIFLFFLVLLINIFEFISKEVYLFRIKNNLNLSFLVSHLSFSSNVNDVIPTLEFDIDWNLLGTDSNAKIMLFNMFNWIVKATEDIGSIFIGAFQDVILILFSGSIFYNALGITYGVYFEIILVIFFILLLVFLSLRYIKISIGKKNSSNIGRHILNSFVLLIMVFLSFQLLFLSFQYIFINVLHMKSFSFDVFHQIKSLTIDNIHNKDKLMETVEMNINIPPFSFNILELLKVKIVIVININKVVFHFKELTIAYIVVFIVSVYFILFNLIKFSLRMFLRLINIVFFGFIGLPFIAASTVEDEGKKMESWNSVLIRKTFSPLLSLVIYLLLIASMDLIFALIDKIDVVLDFSSSNDALILTLKIVVLNGTFLVLNSFNEKITKTDINYEMENDDYSNIKTFKKVDYSFDDNYDYFLVGNNNKEQIKNYKFSLKSFQNNNFNQININDTLEKINNKDE